MTDRHKPRRDYMRRLMWAIRHSTKDDSTDDDTMLATQHEDVNSEQPAKQGGPLNDTNMLNPEDAHP